MDTADEVIEVLSRFKNVILEGPPGTGKTHLLKVIGDRWAAKTNRPLAGHGEGNFAMTFHPSTSYEDFVEGLRYNDEDGGFERRDGFLRRVIDAAKADHDHDYLVLLDELNRANVPKVLGDVLLCMEDSKRQRWVDGDWAGGMEVTLPYSQAPFAIPDNVYLVGTMNTADQSIAPLDAALRRRFGFVRVEPLLGDDLLKALQATAGDQKLTASLQRSVAELTNLNQVLRAGFGPDAMLGHAYLYGALEQQSTAPTLLPSASDLLQPVRDVAIEQNATRAVWIEARKLFFDAFNQMNIPEANAKTGPGLLDTFYPMSSEGNVVTDALKDDKARDSFEVHIDGETLFGNTIVRNSGGNNVKLMLNGRTADNRGINSILPKGVLQHKLLVWLRRPDDTFDLVYLDLDDAHRTALIEASNGDVWRTSNSSSGRSYGYLQLPKLVAPAAQPVQATRAEPAGPEGFIWRYTILPQLINTLTQLGAAALLDRHERQRLLAGTNLEYLAERLVQFDNFLQLEFELFLNLTGRDVSQGIEISRHPREPEDRLPVWDEDAGLELDDEESGDDASSADD